MLPDGQIEEIHAEISWLFIVDSNFGSCSFRGKCIGNEKSEYGKAVRKIFHSFFEFIIKWTNFNIQP
jgi:hypothetical protein